MSTYTRTRSQGGVDGVWVSGKFTSPTYSPSEDPHVAFLANVRGSTKSIHDVPHPGFRNRVKQGEIIMGDMAIMEQVYTTSDHAFVYCPHPEWGVSTIEGPLAAWCGDVSPTPFNDRILLVRQDVINACFAKMNQSPLMAGEFASGFTQTLSMLRRPFRSAIELVSEIGKSRARRLALKRTLTWTKATMQAWLEYRYGWKPLIMDCDTAIVEAQKLRAKHEFVRSVARAGRTVTHKESKNYLLTGLGSWTTLSSYGTAEFSGECSVTAGVIYEVNTPRSTAERVVTSLGLLPKDVPATVWEIIPFSFVVDWFAGVGNWISANVPNPNVRVLGSWCTEKKKWEVNCSPEFYRAPMTWRGVLYPAKIEKVGDHTKSVKEVARDCGVSPTSLPPSKGINLSVVQQVDALSLIGTQLLRDLSKLRH
jgi:hypothetical protein